MIPIDAGSFEMGCTEGQSGCESDESPVHTVHLTRDFYMAETEVTQAQWESVMGSNPSANLWCGESCPVESVSWGQAIAFANTLSELEGLTPAYAENDETYSLDLDADGYRLPTEAEWEFADSPDPDGMRRPTSELGVILAPANKTCSEDGHKQGGQP